MVNNNHTETVVVGQTMNVGSKRKRSTTESNGGECSKTAVVNNQITETMEGNKKTDINKKDQELHEEKQTIKVKNISIS